MKILKLILVAACVLLSGCGTPPSEEPQPYFLQGAWTLSHVDYPMGGVDDYSIEGNGTFCHIYSRDSTLYECKIATTPTGLVILPTAKCVITLIDKGGGELLYLEASDPHPLTVSSDTTIVIQRSGALYTWVRADDIYREWGDEICSIVANELADDDEYLSHYVLSVKERRQETTIHWLLYAIGIILVVSVQVIVAGIRSRRRLHVRLQQIQEEHDERALSVRQAMMAEEDRFFASDEYDALQRRVATGQLLKEEEWNDIEAQTKKVYPGFCSSLRTLHPMSALEYQVCLLIKLRIAPTDIAAVLARDVSTISTVRSRLYKKVFGRKGGAKEWDDFILSIGT